MHIALDNLGIHADDGDFFFHENFAHILQKPRKVLPYDYDRMLRTIAQYEEKMAFGDYRIVRKKSNGRYGAIDENGYEKIPCRYLSVGIAEGGRAFERTDNLFDIYNTKGELITEGATY